MFHSELYGIIYYYVNLLITRESTVALDRSRCGALRTVPLLTGVTYMKMLSDVLHGIIHYNVNVNLLIIRQSIADLDQFRCPAF